MRILLLIRRERITVVNFFVKSSSMVTLKNYCTEYFLMNIMSKKVVNLCGDCWRVKISVAIFVRHA